MRIQYAHRYCLSDGQQMDPRNGASSRKTAANVDISNDLLRQAPRHGIDWRRENRSATEACNRRIEREGVFSDGLRSF
jgi:post-segregation antitoxin (ccd killing protein)